MSITKFSSQQRIVTAILLLCFVVYTFGAYLTRVYLCEPIGAWVLLGGVSVAILLAAMFLLIGVLTAPGCSGV